MLIIKYTLLSMVVLLGTNAQQNAFPEAPFCEPYQSNIGNFFVKSFYFVKTNFQFAFYF